MIVAKWTVNGIFHADAQTCADEVLSIGEIVTPEQVLEKAKDENTELHKCFTWDNDVAADKWRLHEAKKVIQFLVIENKDDDSEERASPRMFYTTKVNEGYKHINIIMQDKDEYQALLERAYNELRAFKRKYSTLSELKDIFESID